MKAQGLSNIYKPTKEDSDNTLFNLQTPIDEIYALTCLMTAAQKADDFVGGQDIDLLTSIIIRRIRILSYRCQCYITRWKSPFEGDGSVERRDPDGNYEE